MAKTTVSKGDGIKAAIASGLNALTTLLGDAVGEQTEAQAEIAEGRQNPAIEKILSLDARLADASVLYRSILVLHRQR